ncbi:MAG: hypothetical protein AAFQ94_10720 [Bacteroidota bacterium]
MSIPLISLSQDVKKSFIFQNEPIAICLKETVESYGFYLSFKQEIFNGHALVSADYQDKTLDEMMKLLLKDDFRYKKIDEYVIINPVTKEKAETVAEEILTDETVVFDTVTIEKVIVHYDTQQIAVRKFFYDTIRIPKEEIFYDTLSVTDFSDSTSRKWQFGGFFGPVMRRRQGADLDADYFGAQVGGSVRYNLENLYLQLDASYQYLLSNVSSSSVTEVMETRTDTISVFFVIEDGVRTPVYVTEEVDITREIQTNIDRTNTLQFLTFSLVGGYELKMTNLSLGLNLGVSADLLLNRDELIFADTELEDNSATQFNNPTVSVVFQMPFQYSKPEFIGSVMMTPYVQYGLNDEFRIPSPGGNRLVAGIKLGIIF